MPVLLLPSDVPSCWVRRSTAWEELDLLWKGQRSFQQKVMTHGPHILLFPSVQEKRRRVQHALSFHHFLARWCYLSMSPQREVHSHARETA